MMNTVQFWSTNQCIIHIPTFTGNNPYIYIDDGSIPISDVYDYNILIVDSILGSFAFVGRTGLMINWALWSGLRATQ